MKLNIPNFLTLLRLILIPIVILLHNAGFVIASFILLMTGVLTDFFDGYFARKFNQKTEFGAIFDPIVDKLVSFSFYSYLYLIEVIPLWFSLIIILRNFSQLLSIPILVWWLKKKFFVRPTWFSKWATALSDIFIFIPLFLSFVGENIIFVCMVVISIVELKVLLTYVPRLYAIATDKHDTFV